MWQTSSCTVVRKRIKAEENWKGQIDVFQKTKIDQSQLLKTGNFLSHTLTHWEALLIEVVQTITTTTTTHALTQWAPVYRSNTRFLSHAHTQWSLSGSKQTNRLSILQCERQLYSILAALFLPTFLSPLLLLRLRLRLLGLYLPLLFPPFPYPSPSIPFWFFVFGQVFLPYFDFVREAEF